MERLGRRRVLAAVGTAAASGLAGCGSGGGADGSDVPPAERGPLEIAEFAFAASEPPSAGEYEPQPERTYQDGDTVWLYTRLEGLAADPLDADDRVRIDLREHVAVEGPGGQQLLDREFTFRERLAAEQLERFYVTNDFGLAPSTEEGAYTVSVAFADRVSGTEAETSGIFAVAD